MGTGKKGGPEKRGAKKEKTLRAFVAVPIPDQVIAYFYSIQTQLASSGFNIRWVKPENIHVTLNFLGEIDASRTSPLTEQLDRLTGSIPPFSLQVKGAGVFPNLRRARVVWAGLTGDLDALHSFHSDVNKELAAAGFRVEKRRFHPHVTIGRCKRSPDGRILGKALDTVQEKRSDIFVVKRLCFYQSVLTSEGAVYICLHTSELQGASLL